MVTVKEVKELHLDFDCSVVIQGEKVSFEEASFGWSGPSDMVPEFLFDLPVNEIVVSFVDDRLKFCLYVPFDMLKAVYTEMELPFSEEVTE